MTREAIEKYQVVIYVAAIISGFFWGTHFPELSLIFESLLWPVLGLLLYTTFTQIRLSKIRHAFVQDRRFIYTALAGNFVLIPLIILIFITFLPDHPPIQLGVALVLLVPCTDWFITFPQLGRGDTERAIAFSPLSLLFQILLLPAYLFLFFGQELTLFLATNKMILAFTGIIILPLIIAWLTERWVEKAPDSRRKTISRLGWMPVPLLAAVIFMIAASQAHALRDASFLLAYPAICYVIFLLSAALLARVLAEIISLPVRQGRTLAFSFGSRNSFVVLPLALALPESFEITVLAVVLQSLIELFGMALYVWLVPGMLFKSRKKMT